jgi:demethylmenaquinone methyltransferase/2-methoxy-6-polyprenyl-1,4-benzoquinol methylase
MFDAIAQRYDLLNRVLSLGFDQQWRRRTAAALGDVGDAKILDLATGTGDLAIRVANMYPRCTVVGVDPSEQMLEVGRSKVDALGLSDRIGLLLGDAQSLPFADGSFAGVTMAFGIRNVPDRERAVAEVARVLRPGAVASILELSEPRSGLLGPLARWHVHRVVPWLGSVLSGAREYRYLQRSIAAFPPPERFVAMLESVGLRDAVATRLSFGACHLYTAQKGQTP